MPSGPKTGFVLEGGGEPWGPRPWAPGPSTPTQARAPHYIVPRLNNAVVAATEKSQALGRAREGRTLAEIGDDPAGGKKRARWA